MSGWLIVLVSKCLGARISCSHNVCVSKRGVSKCPGVEMSGAEMSENHLQVTLVDHLTGQYREKKLLQLEKDWIINMGTSGPTGLNTRNQLLTNQRRNWGLH